MRVHRELKPLPSDAPDVADAHNNSSRTAVQQSQGDIQQCRHIKRAGVTCMPNIMMQATVFGPTPLNLCEPLPPLSESRTTH